jgi:hypothetical protein
MLCYKKQDLREIKNEIIFLLPLLLSGCVLFVDTSSEARHKWWIEDKESIIGKGNMHDCRLRHCPYRQGNLFLGDRVLPNGNLEAGFIDGHNQPKCRYYYEYEPKTGVIVEFRFEESERFACRHSGA